MACCLRCGVWGVEMAYLVLFVFGTRAEAIKMAPLIRRMAGNPAWAVLASA